MGPTATVRTQSTTRSPVVPIDRDGYAVRCALRFAAPDDPGRDSFVYNVSPAGGGFGSVVMPHFSRAVRPSPAPIRPPRSGAG